MGMHTWLLTLWSVLIQSSNTTNLHKSSNVQRHQQSKQIERCCSRWITIFLQFSSFEKTPLSTCVQPKLGILWHFCDRVPRFSLHDKYNRQPFRISFAPKVKIESRGAHKCHNMPNFLSYACAQTGVAKLCGEGKRRIRCRKRLFRTRWVWPTLLWNYVSYGISRIKCGYRGYSTLARFCLSPVSMLRCVLQNKTSPTHVFPSTRGLCVFFFSTDQIQNRW